MIDALAKNPQFSPKLLANVEVKLLWAHITRCMLYLAVGGISLATTLGMLLKSDLATLATSASALIVILGLALAAFMYFLEGNRPNRATTLILFSIFLSGVIPYFRITGDALSTTAEWTIGHACLFFFALLSPALDLRIVLRSFGLLMLASICTIFLGPLAFSVDARNVFAEGRLTGVLGHPNVTGMAAAVTVVLALQLGRAMSIYTIAAVIVLVGSLSLTSLVCVGAGLALLIARPNHIWRVWIVIFGAVAYFAPTVLIFAGAQHIDTSLFTGRVAVWEWVANQKLGNGLEFFTENQLTRAIPWAHAHNQLLMDLATGGIAVATLTFLSILILGRLAVGTRSALTIAVWTMLVAHSVTEVPLFLDYFGGRLILAVLIVLVLLVGASDGASSVTPKIGIVRALRSFRIGQGVITVPPIG